MFVWAPGRVFNYIVKSWSLVLGFNHPRKPIVCYSYDLVALSIIVSFQCRFLKSIRVDRVNGYTYILGVLHRRSFSSINFTDLV